MTRKNRVKILSPWQKKYDLAGSRKSEDQVSMALASNIFCKSLINFYVWYTLLFLQHVLRQDRIFFPFANKQFIQGNKVLDDYDLYTSARRLKKTAYLLDKYLSKYLF